MVPESIPHPRDRKMGTCQRAGKAKDEPPQVVLGTGAPHSLSPWALIETNNKEHL